MDKDIAVIENTQNAIMTISDVTQQLKMVHELYKTIMIKDEHYGKIPGTKKDTLFKAGAEKLNVLFKLVPKVENKTVRDLDGGHREYEITIGLYHRTTGEFWGQGVGSCSTMEKKFRYRYEKGQKVENADIADVYNTILKMAYKRALVSATISATGVSDIFTQDVEDFADNQVDNVKKAFNGTEVNNSVEKLKALPEKTKEGLRLLTKNNSKKAIELCMMYDFDVNKIDQHLKETLQ